MSSYYFSWDPDADAAEDPLTPGYNYFKFKCNNPNGCESNDDKSDDDQKTPYGGVVCAIADNADTSSGVDCKELLAGAMKDDGIFDISLVDKTEVRSFSCVNDVTSKYEKGCGASCRVDGKTPYKCKANGCRFVFGNTLTKERRKECQADLGCREWDDCNIQCKELCTGQCKWTSKGCAFNSNFVDPDANGGRT